MKTNERTKYTYLTVQLMPTEKELEMLQTTWNNYKKACNIFSRTWYYILAKEANMDVSAYKKKTLKSSLGLAQKLLHAVYEDSMKYTMRTAYNCRKSDKKLKLIAFGEYDEKNVNQLTIPYLYKSTFNVDFANKVCRLDLAKSFQTIAFSLPEKLPEPPASWEVKRAYLQPIYGTWYMTLMYPNPMFAMEVRPDTHIVGVDRGKINVATTYSKEKGAKRYGNKKQVFQLSKGCTKDDLHKALFAYDITVANNIVKEESLGTMFVLEDLHFDQSPKGWSYHHFGDVLIYLAALHHQSICFCDPRNTSRTCPRCGAVVNTERNLDEHRFICRRCGYGKYEYVNDDDNAAKNIYLRGRKMLFGES